MVRPDVPLSVIQLCAPGSIGGLERVVQGLSIGLAEAGNKVHVIGVQQPGSAADQFFDEMTHRGVTVSRVVLGAREYRAERNAVAEQFDRLAPAVLHAHGYRSDLLHRGNAQRRGIRAVTTLHGTSQLRGLAAVYEWVHERSLRSADAVIAVSQPIQEHLLPLVPRDRLFCVPNGWIQVTPPLTRADARAALQLDPETKVVGWVGRLVEVKGADLFLDALRRMHPGNWIACIIGDGPERTMLESRAAEMGIADRVRFVGALVNAGQYATAFDLSCLSSRSEGTPIALLESMAAGVPTVAFAVGGIPHVIGDGVEGWLVPPLDASKLATALTDALESSSERARRAASARARLKRQFSSDAWIAAHEGIYRGAVMHSKSPATGGEPGRHGRHRSR